MFNCNLAKWPPAAGKDLYLFISGVNDRSLVSRGAEMSSVNNLKIVWVRQELTKLRSPVRSVLQETGKLGNQNS